MKSHFVLVVGGGFLGRAIAMKLAGGGWRVTLLSPRASEMAWPDGIRAVDGRQEDTVLLGRLLDGQDAVVHAAWGTTPGSSAERPALEAERGLHPFLAFLDMLQHYPGMRLLFLSSGGTVYGNPDQLPVTESALLQPLSCHGAGKVAAELFLHLRSPDQTVILRPSNIYGPGQPLRRDFGVVQHLLRCALEEKPFQMWGDGSQLRDYLYIDDFTDAVSRLAARPEVSGALNLGSGAGTSLSELVGLAERATKRAIRIEHLPPRPGDVGRIVLDIGRIRQATDWSPATTLAEGIDRTMRRLDGSHG